ncbi:MAG: hypothetical protein ABEK59_10860 [Halobacteria archaeon]
MGCDTKIVQNKGVEVQDSIKKYKIFEHSGLKTLCCYAGKQTVAERMISRINPEEVDGARGLSFATYLNEIVEEKNTYFL